MRERKPWCDKRWVADHNSLRLSESNQDYRELLLGHAQTTGRGDKPVFRWIDDRPLPV